MKRTIAIGLVMGTLLLPLSGCGDAVEKAAADKPATTTSEPSPSPKPEEVFAKAVRMLNGQSLKFTVGDDKDQFTGGFDAASGGVKVTGDLDGEKMDVVVVGNDIYLGGLLPNGQWLHAQASKFKDTAVSFLVLVDPLFATQFLTTAAGVTQAEPNTYSGTIDLTKVATTGPAQRMATDFAKAAGAKATELPFTATTDAAGALASLSITFPKADTGDQDLKYVLKVTEVGGTFPVAAPPKNKTSEAPSDIYEGP